MGGPSVGTDTAGTFGGLGGGSGEGERGTRDQLIAAIRVCEMERPGLAIGDTTYNLGWSFKTYDDTVWPFVYRCMKAHGYKAYGTDFSATSDFGSSVVRSTEAQF